MAHGGQRAGAGKKRGVPNKVTKDVRELARQYTAEAVERLAFWMRSGEGTPSVKATKELLDRGWGQPKQDHEITGALTVLIHPAISRV